MTTDAELIDLDTDTERILNLAYRDQLTHTRGLIHDALIQGTSDDGTDYLGAALDVSSLMLDLHRDTDTDGFIRLLTTTDLNDTHACDGICPTLQRLNAMHGPDPDLD